MPKLAKLPEKREAPMTPAQASPWLTRALGKQVSTRMVQYYCEQGALPHLKLGSRYLLWGGELSEWLAAGGRLPTNGSSVPAGAA